MSCFQINTRAGRASRKMLADATIDLSRQRLVEPAIVDSEPAVLESVEDICVLASEENGRVIVGFPRMDGLRRNNIIPRHHHDKRNG